MSHRLGIVTYRPDPSDVAKMREANPDPSASVLPVGQEKNILSPISGF